MHPRLPARPRPPKLRSAGGMQRGVEDDDENENEGDPERHSIRGILALSLDAQRPHASARGPIHRRLALAPLTPQEKRSDARARRQPYPSCTRASEPKMKKRPKPDARISRQPNKSYPRPGFGQFFCLCVRQGDAALSASNLKLPYRVRHVKGNVKKNSEKNFSCNGTQARRLGVSRGDRPGPIRSPESNRAQLCRLGRVSRAVDRPGTKAIMRRRRGRCVFSVRMRRNACQTRSRMRQHAGPDT